MPDSLPWLAGIRARPLASLVLLILVLQAAGHVACACSGARRGLAASDFFGGFVSSTATIAASARVRACNSCRWRWPRPPVRCQAAPPQIPEMLLMAAALTRPGLALLWAPALASTSRPPAPWQPCGRCASARDSHAP